MLVSKIGIFIILFTLTFDKKISYRAIIYTLLTL